MVAVFVRLKLALLRNSLRGDVMRTVLVVLSIPFGLMLTVIGFAGLATARTVPLPEAAAFSAVLVTGVTLMWLVSPLYLFASDNTLDPARLVLLPLRARELMAGMAAAAWVGLPPLATLVAFSGTLIGLGRSPGGVAAALVGVVLATGLCLYTSRALATALAGALRSRRGRDLGAAMLILLVGSVGVLAAAVPALLTQPGVFDAVATICRWTPPGLAVSAGADASAGRWGMVAVDLAGASAALALVIVWWGRRLAAGLISSGPASSSRRQSARSALFPRVVGRWIPRTRAGAVFARDLRYAWRSPYRRSSTALAFVVGPFLGFGPGLLTGGAGAGAVFVGCWTASIYAVSMANALGYEGRSLWLHSVVPGPSRPDWLGRILASATVGAVPSVLASTAAAAVTGHWAPLPAVIGLIATILAAECGASALIAVLVPYPMPDVDANPFSTGAGGGIRAILGVFGGLAIAGTLTAPVLALTIAGLLGWAPGFALACVVGLAYAPLLIAGASWLAGALHDMRGPEVLATVASGR